MKLAIVGLIATLALYAQVPPAPSTQDEAAALIDQATKAYRALKQYHFIIETTNDFIRDKGASRTESQTVVAVQAPNKVRLEMSQETGSFTLVSDGKTLWRINRDTHEFTRTPIVGPILDMKGGGRVAESMLAQLRRSERGLAFGPEALKSASILGSETIEVGDAEVECTVVRAEYTVPPAAIGLESIVRTFWIDRRRNLPLRDEFLSTGTEPYRKPHERFLSRWINRYKVSSVDETIPESLFTYDPPANYREVDKLEFGSMNSGGKQLIGKPAPELTSKTLTGEPFNLSALRGKLVLLDFWATWCEPCRSQMPSIAKLYGATKDGGLAVIGVNDEDPQTALKYLNENHYGWPSVLDSDNKGKSARAAFQVGGIPTLVLIDREGKIAEYQVGFGTQSEGAIKAALHKLGVDAP